MQAAEAFEWAADYAERSKLFEPVRNERGFADGWKPPTPAEKVQVIKTLADAVTDKSLTFDGEHVIGFVESMWDQHKADGRSGVEGRELIHVNFLQEVRDHFRGRA